MNKEYDFSEFDAEVKDEDQEYDFSDFDNEVSKVESSKNIDGIVKGTGTGLGILAGQKVIEKSGIGNKLSELPKKTLGVMGELSLEQIETIKNNPEKYNTKLNTEDIATKGEDIERAMQSRIFENKKLAERVISDQDIELDKDHLQNKLDSLRSNQQYRTSEKLLEEGKDSKEALSNLKTQIEELKNKPMTVSSKEASNIRTKKLESLQEKYNQLKNKAIEMPKGSNVNIDEIDKYINSEKDFLSKVEAPKGKEAVDYLQKVRSDANYNKALGTESFSNKMAKKYGKEIRDMIGEQSPEYDTLMKSSSNLINDRKELASLLGLKGNTKTGEKLTTTNSTVSRIERILKNPESPDYKNLQKLLEKNNISDFLTDLEIASIQKKVDSNTGVKMGDLLRGMFLGKANPTAGLSFLGYKSLGTKAQEQIALASENKVLKGLGKAAKGLGKLAYKSLPLLGAAAAYEEAQAADFSPLETAGYIAAEELNPLPVSSKDIYEGLKKAGERRGSSLVNAADRARLANVKNRLMNTQNRNNVIDSFRNMDSSAAQDFANQLEKISDNRDGHTTTYNLVQQPAFRELLRRMEKSKNDDGEETN